MAQQGRRLLKILISQIKASRIVQGKSMSHEFVDRIESSVGVLIRILDSIDEEEGSEAEQAEKEQLLKSRQDMLNSFGGSEVRTACGLRDDCVVTA